MQSQIAETNSNVERQTTTIQDVQDTISNLVEGLDSRIAAKISESKEATDSSLLELKTAVQQIKDTLASGVSGTCDLSGIYESLERYANQLAGLQSDDVLLYQIIYHVRDELLTLITSTDTTLKEELAEYKETLNQNLDNAETAFDDKLTKEKNYLISRVSDLEAKTTREISALYTTHSNRIAENKKAINDLSTTVAINKAEAKDDVSELSERISNTVRSISNITLTASETKLRLTRCSRASLFGRELNLSRGFSMQAQQRETSDFCS